ncbi:MAG: B3/4 domain-containing protein [Eubacteriales bacterium]|nr:B3/4 domain-containing protein [Eubacteriales bacterium]
MRKFIVEKSFWELFPEAKIGVIVFSDIDNRIKDEEQFKEILRKAERLAMLHLPKEDFSSNDVIKVWRDAFQKFKTKKGARSSVEALLKRAHKGDPIGTINPLVDLYNSISLKYALPCGGEDIDTFVGDIRLTKANGDEPFITLGSEESAPPNKDEIVYKDDAGAICRCWNWRESVRTMLTEKTTNAFLCIELVNESRVKDLKDALGELAKLAEENLGGTYQISILDTDNREISIE